MPHRLINTEQPEGVTAASPGSASFTSSPSPKTRSHRSPSQFFQRHNQSPKPSPNQPSSITRKQQQHLHHARGENVKPLAYAYRRDVYHNAGDTEVEDDKKIALGQIVCNIELDQQQNRDSEGTSAHGHCNYKLKVTAVTNNF